MAGSLEPSWRFRASRSTGSVLAWGFEKLRLEVPLGQGGKVLSLFSLLLPPVLPVVSKACVGMSPLAMVLGAEWQGGEEGSLTLLGSSCPREIEGCLLGQM